MSLFYHEDSLVFEEGAIVVHSGPMSNDRCVHGAELGSSAEDVYLHY